ncbi:MAG: hypothetical protein KDA25_00430, partial [Phycisphaerales bacterium]|nr:hypothetical protein [Phycisphaerales bacterium]
MPDLLHRLNLLRARTPNERLRILIPTLTHAEDDELDVIAAELLRFGGDHALAAVIRQFHRLGDARREHCCTAVADPRPAARIVLDRNRRAATLNVIDFARHALDPRLAPILVECLAASHRDVPAAAALALAAMVSARVEPAAGHEDPLDAAVADALARYPDHRQEPVVVAAARMAVAPGPRLAALLAETDHPAMFALRRAVGDTDDPTVRREFLRWLGRPVLAGQVARRLHDIVDAAPRAEVMSNAHLLRVPARRRMMRLVDRPIRCIPPLAQAVTDPEFVQCALPGWIRALGVSTAIRVRSLADLVALPAPLARLLAIEELRRETAPLASEVVALAMLDREPRIARLAAIATCFDGKPVKEDTLLRAARSTDAPLAALARHRLARRSIGRFMAVRDDLPPAAAAAAGAFHLEHDRSAFVDAMRAALDGGPASGRRRAVALARRLRIVPDVALSLIRLTRENDPRLVSAAVAAMADATDESSLRLVALALDHAEPRVAANAVEAWAARRPREYGRIEPKCDSRVHRVRANAIRAVIQTGAGDGETQLHRMLDDDDERHRVSGIWAASAARSVDMIAHLRFLVQRDPSN